MNKTKLFAIALAATLPAAAPAQLADGEVRISYADLNLAKAEGREVLDRRLARAIDRLCAAPNGLASLARIKGAARCAEEKKAQVAALRSLAVARHGSSTQLAAADR